jgi:hypothetical protein
MLLQRKGLLSWLSVFQRHPGFQRPHEQRGTVPECATRRICGSAKGHDFSRAVKRSQFDTFGASAPEASAAKAGERQIIRRGCGTTPDGNHRDRFRRALSQVAARPSRRAPAPACRGPVPTFFVGMPHPRGATEAGREVASRVNRMLVSAWFDHTRSVHPLDQRAPWVQPEVAG